MKDKLRSRKLWMAVISGLLIILNDGFEMGLDNQTILSFSGIVITYLIGQSAVDVKTSKNA
jgi:hypothetical protein